MFAPASGAHKRPRIERIHGTVKKPIPHLPESAPRDIHPPLDFNNLGYIPHGGPMTPQSYTRQVVQFTESGPVTLTLEEAVRRYSVIHAETEAARARWDAETEEAAQRWADSLPDTPQAIISGTAAAQTAGSQVVIAPTQVAIAQEVVAPTQVAIAQEVVAPTQVAIHQEVAPVPPTSHPVHASSVSSMLQSFGFEVTRSGYYDDYEYPQI